MTFNEYQEAAEKTAIYPQHLGAGYPILGLCGETGELANKYKKVLRDKSGILGLSDLISLSDELGDSLWYISEIARHLGFTLEQIAEKNITKLKIRQEHGSLQGSGDNR